MAPRLTYKTITFLGLTQVGVVVAGVLAAGVTSKYFVTFGMVLHRSTRIATDYGSVALAIPVLWITVAMVVQHRNETADAPEAATFASGIVVLLVLLAGGFLAAVVPWFSLCSLGLSA